jgi:hypothetical protein
VLSKQTHMLRPGMYMLRLKFANATYVEKLLIQNRFAE